MKREYVLSILVRNRPGVLTKIAGMFYRRGHNISTLTVGKMHKEGISKLIISLMMEMEEVELLRRQIENLVNVESAVLLPRDQSILTEVCLIRLRTRRAGEREEIMVSAMPYRPRILGVDPGTIVLEVADKKEIIDDFVETMGKYGIVDVSRTGMTALGPEIEALEKVYEEREDDYVERRRAL
jgi:acetolactate synthase-1/3 small subunit